MSIRYAKDEDIPKIVELLKSSLGESLMPKSETYWRWKHIDNPFGRSPVLIAEENNRIVGVRAFMRWEWKENDIIYKSVRAVDTATHPDYQGRGIFRKLTLKLIETNEADGVEFIFNTPNKSSRPGYLKMGWQDAGRLPIRILPVNPFHYFQKHAKNITLDFEQWIEKSETNSVTENLFTGNQLNTHQTLQYLKWRYSHVPVVSYFVVTGAVGESCICRVKKSKFGKELRIADHLSAQRTASHKMMKNLQIAAVQKGAWHITFSGVDDAIKKGFVLPVGPLVTIRNINSLQFYKLFAFKGWRPSLGDLELF